MANTAIYLLQCLAVAVVASILVIPQRECYVLRVVGYQNKSHVMVLAAPSGDDPNYPGPRPQIIDVPEYTYRLTMDCPQGHKPDGTGRCRPVWP